MENGKTNSRLTDSIGTAKERVEHAVLKDRSFTREELASWLARDLKSVHQFVSEIIDSPEAIEALTEVYWKRYQAYHGLGQEVPND